MWESASEASEASEHRAGAWWSVGRQPRGNRPDWQLTRPSLRALHLKPQAQGRDRDTSTHNNLQPHHAPRTARRTQPSRSAMHQPTAHTSNTKCRPCNGVFLHRSSERLRTRPIRPRRQHSGRRANRRAHFASQRAAHPPPLRSQQRSPRAEPPGRLDAVPDRTCMHSAFLGIAPAASSYQLLAHASQIEASAAHSAKNPCYR